MSTPILPFAVWLAGTNQNSIPANDNSLRNQILNGLVISDSVTAQPGTPAHGDIYIIPSGATGTQWATFDENDLAIYDSGTWYAYAPAEGVVVNLAGTLTEWQGSGGWVAIGSGGGGAVDSVNGQTGVVVLALDDLDGVDATTPTDQDVLTWDSGTSAWIPQAGGGGGSTTVTVITEASTVTVDCSLGDYFTLALSENVTAWTFTNVPPGASIMIQITQGATPRTVAWPASFTWAGGTAGEVSTAASGVDLLAITTFSAGSTWRATLGKGFA